MSLPVPYIPQTRKHVAGRGRSLSDDSNKLKKHARGRNFFHFVLCAIIPELSLCNFFLSLRLHFIYNCKGAHLEAAYRMRSLQVFVVISAESTRTFTVGHLTDSSFSSHCAAPPPSLSMMHFYPTNILNWMSISRIKQIRLKFRNSQVNSVYWK